MLSRFWLIYMATLNIFSANLILGYIFIEFIELASWVSGIEGFVTVIS